MKKIILSLTNWDEYPHQKSFERILEVTDEEFDYLKNVQQFERGLTTSGILNVVEYNKKS